MAFKQGQPFNVVPLALCFKCVGTQGSALFHCMKRRRILVSKKQIGRPVRGSESKEL
jgi:hypothetical protein